MKVLRKIAGKTKVDRMRNQQTADSCSVQPINEWKDRIRKEWDEQMTSMDSKRLVTISRFNSIYLLEDDFLDAQEESRET